MIPPSASSFDSRPWTCALVPLRSGLLVFALLLAACSGGEDAPEGCEGQECTSCIPLSCSDLGAQCGLAEDGCGATLACGECEAWEQCGSDAPNVCNIDCGNGVVDPGEECDDGNRVTEFCDYGEDWSCSVCDRFCEQGSGKLHWCGDGFVQEDQGEECDDTNDVDWDDCDLECQRNPCQFEEVFGTTRDNVRGVVIAGEHLYLADDKTISIFDISTPSAPIQVATFSDAINARFEDLAIKDGHLLVPGRGMTLAVYSLANPTAPVLVTSIDQFFPTGGIQVQGNRAYLAAGSSGFTIVDITSVTAPSVLGSVDTVSSVKFGRAHGDTLLLGTSTGIHSYDISDPAAPVFVNRWDPLPDDGITSDISSFVINGNRLYTNGGTPKVRTLDISDPTNPLELISNFEAPSGLWGPSLQWESGKLLMALSEGVFVLDASAGVVSANLGGIESRLIRHMTRMDDVVYVTADNDGFGGSNHYFRAIRITCEDD